MARPRGGLLACEAGRLPRRLHPRSGEIDGSTAQVQLPNAANQMSLLARQLHPSLGLGGWEIANTRLPASDTLLVAFDRAGERVIRGHSGSATQYSTFAQAMDGQAMRNSEGNYKGFEVLYSQPACIA